MIEAAEAAREWWRTPFRWEASLKGKGCDCRGLISGIARDLGRPEAEAIEANVVGYAGKVNEAALLEGLDRVFERRTGDMQIGDVLALRLGRKAQHLAIVTGEGRMTHAYYGDPGLVCEVPIGKFWGRRIVGAWAWR
jgi:NlpC/P60 family putative phage cell wall peptidase